MKRFAFVFTLLITYYLLLVTFVRADFNSVYQDYLGNYDQYRARLTDFLVAKNRYLSYRTLVSQKEALVTGQALLTTRNQTVTGYLKILLEKNTGESFRRLIDEELSFYAEKEDVFTAAGSLEDLKKISSTIENHYSQTELLARRVIASLILQRLRDLEKRLADLEKDFRAEVDSLRTGGKDVTTVDRWLLSAYNKRLMAEDKIRQVEKLADSLTEIRVDQSTQKLKETQTVLFEANQYLKEALSYLKEIKEEIKYGNY